MSDASPGSSGAAPDGEPSRQFALFVNIACDQDRAAPSNMREGPGWPAGPSLPIGAVAKPAVRAAEEQRRSAQDSRPILSQTKNNKKPGKKGKKKGKRKRGKKKKRREIGRLSCADLAALGSAHCRFRDGRDRQARTGRHPGPSRIRWRRHDLDRRCHEQGDGRRWLASGSGTLEPGLASDIAGKPRARNNPAAGCAKPRPTEIYERCGRRRAQAVQSLLAVRSYSCSGHATPTRPNISNKTALGRSTRDQWARQCRGHSQTPTRR